MPGILTFSAFVSLLVFLVFDVASHYSSPFEELLVPCLDSVLLLVLLVSESPGQRGGLSTQAWPESEHSLLSHKKALADRPVS